MIRRERGSSLLIIVLLVLIVGLNFLIINDTFSHIIATLQWSTHRQRSLLKVASNAITTPIDANLDGLFCKNFETRTGSTQIERTLCQDQSSLATFDTAINQVLIDGSRSRMPNFDYAKIFHDSDECLELRPFSISLSRDGALNASSTCVFHSLIPSKLTLQHNLQRSGTSISLRDINWNIIGFVNIASKMVVSGSIVIIAGGTVEIASLECSQYSQVLLVSATGRVQVDTFEGSPCLKVISKLSPNVPNSALKLHSLFPDPLPVQVLTLYPKW